MDNLGTDARGRGKVDFAQVVKVGRECERGRDPSLPLLGGICLWQADVSLHLFVTGRCLSGRVLVKRPDSHFLFTIGVIKNRWSLVLNDT